MADKPRLLVIDDEPALAEVMSGLLQMSGYLVDSAGSSDAAEKLIRQGSYALVFCDIQLPGRSGIRLLEDLKSSGLKVPGFIFVTGHRDPGLLERANRIGIADVVMKPFTKDELLSVAQKVLKRSTDQVHDVMEMMNKISGITLGEEKRKLVETRLYRRARELGLPGLEEYLKYFEAHREAEVAQILSHVTTHHTDFFRETEHFDFLVENVFPAALRNKKSLKIWSAACSTGEEIYSIAIAWLEFLRNSSIDEDKAPKLQLIATDIDDKTVDRASNGIYDAQRVARMQPELVKRYFDVGQGDLAGLVRVKESIHRLCQFGRYNLHSPVPPYRDCDAIFVRNVLIYFTIKDIEFIANRLQSALAPAGYLILGHSESLTGTNSNMRSLGNSVYQTPVAATSPVATISGSPQRRPERSGPIKTFIIDDSPTVRAMLKQIFKSKPEFEVVGEADNPVDAEPLLAKAKPDVITLDIHMPKMDGISYLKTLQGKDHPPIVMISSVSYDDAVKAMTCFELGASAYIEKPQAGQLAEKSEEIIETIKAAANHRRQAGNIAASSVRTAAIEYQKADSIDDLILIGASTGGVEAIRRVIEQFPAYTPPILIVQHIPPEFSRAFANRLSTLCKIKVSEAVDGEYAEESHAYIAPGGKQMGVIRAGNRLRIQLTDDAPVNRHRPSVDYLFDSVARHGDRFRMTAAILTGMGGDGAKGLLNLKNVGAHTIAQDEDSCVVFGMPKVAIEMNAHNEVLPLMSIAYHLFQPFKKRKAA
jgi:two-component system chemotaxis response regulator CheB